VKSLPSLFSFPRQRGEVLAFFPGQRGEVLAFFGVGVNCSIVGGLCFLGLLMISDCPFTINF
ncbi:MAG: hypothetical protein PSN36_03300, partial [Gammaproteobacteria bacterium]|nr:hypothetical protein [Gammaproteobacteria bacterium]